MKNNKKGSIVLITGAPKTATSTLVGILNCHPKIFILYETILKSPNLGKYARRFLKKYPNLRYLFRFNSDPNDLYLKLLLYLKKRGFPFEIIGDKIPTLDNTFLRIFRNNKIIFTVRDIRSWLCKNFIIDFYLIKRDIVPVAIDYCIYFLESFLLPNVLHFRLNEIIYDHGIVIEKLGAFLNMEMRPYLNEWWKRIDNFKLENPKSFLEWQRGHPSSAIKPENEDVIIKLNSHPFWDSLLPIFDKYYNNLGKPFDTNEINQDIKNLNSLMRFSPVPLNIAYESFENINLIYDSKKQNKGIKLILIKLIRKVEDLYRQTSKNLGLK